MREMIELLKVPLHSVRQRKAVFEVYSWFHAFGFTQPYWFGVLKLVTCLMSTSRFRLHESCFCVGE